MTLINSLTTEIKSNLWNFLLYNKPKSIKIVLDIIDKVYNFYGRNTDDNNAKNR